MRLPAAALLVLATATPAAAEAPAGGIKGTVIFEGEAPDRPPLVRKSDAVCAKTPRLSEDIVVTKGKLRDVLVRVTVGAPPPPPTDESSRPTPAVLEQRECMYEPRVFAIQPAQQIVVRNQDDTFHNIHGTLRGKDLFNQPHPKRSPEVKLEHPGDVTAGDVVELACDVHPWMHAYAVVVGNPYYAVTAENGSFEIKGLPPGRYTIEAYHPVLGTRTLDVQVGKGNKAVAIARLSYKRP